MKCCKKPLAGLLALLVLSLCACGGEPAAEPQITSVPASASAPPAASPQSAGAAAFSDVSAGADYAQAVAWCYEKGILNGTSETTFAPDATLTRAMLATALYRYAGTPALTGAARDFSDVPSGQWYTRAVQWANVQGLLMGYGDGLFGPGDPVSVEQVQVILDRYLGRGDTWTGDPDRAQDATRAQVAQSLYNELYKIEMAQTAGGEAPSPS